jgi:hypothetical protein
MRSSSSKSIGHRVAVFVALTLAAVSMLSVAMPVALESPRLSAQSFGSRDDTFREEEPTVRWLQGSSADDEVEFLGSDEFRGSGGQQFARELLAAMGASTTDVSFHRPDDLFDEGIELSARLPQHLLDEQNGWRATIDVQAIAAAMQTRGFTAFDIDLCTVIGADIDYPVPSEMQYDDCESWFFRTAEAVRTGGVLSVVEDPSAAGYNGIVLWLAIGSLVATVVLTASTVALRRKRLPELGGANLVIASVGVMVAAAAITSTAGVFAASVGSVDDAVLAGGGGWKHHVTLVMLPAFVTALPFLLPAIAIVLAKPRTLKSEQTTAAGGVPYWMMAPGAQQPGTASTPAAPPQPAAPPTAMPPPPTPQPPSSSSDVPRWDPPS